MSNGCLLSRGFRFIVEGFKGTRGGSGLGLEISGLFVSLLEVVKPLVLGVLGESLESVSPDGGRGGTDVGLVLPKFWLFLSLRSGLLSGAVSPGADRPGMMGFRMFILTGRSLTGGFSKPSC